MENAEVHQHTFGKASSWRSYPPGEDEKVYTYAAPCPCGALEVGTWTKLAYVLEPDAARNFSLDPGSSDAGKHSA